MSLVKMNRSTPASSADSRRDRREALLLTAAGLFLDKGYSATSVDEIAQAAGMTGPALYRIFDGKQHILDELCLTGMDMRLAGIQGAIDRHRGDPMETMRHLVRARIDFAYGPWGCQAPITLSEYRHLSPAAALKVDTASEIGMSEWLRYLAQIRPAVPTRNLLAIIYAVLLEISYVALYIEELESNAGARDLLERLAMAGLMSGD